MNRVKIFFFAVVLSFIEVSFYATERETGGVINL